ncbi:hypothetical protein [Sphingomonas phyllosphaerae]|nr:hypothetical protein [Sphingomonas phyllosphaerae]
MSINARRTVVNALAAHRASAHFPSHLASVNNLAERSAFTLDPLAIG